jgi:c-di-GMP-binding flagellar brake protein YcgR
MNQLTIALALSAVIILNLCISFIIRLSKMQHKAQACINAIQNCTLLERRKVLRSTVPVTVKIRQPVIEEQPVRSEYAVRDISSGGLYLYTDQRADFDPGEVIDLVVDCNDCRFYTGKAEVVHSQAVFNNESVITETGIGVKFLKHPNEYPEIK